MPNMTLAFHNSKSALDLSGQDDVLPNSQAAIFSKSAMQLPHEGLHPDFLQSEHHKDCSESSLRCQSEERHARLLLCLERMRLMFSSAVKKICRLVTLIQRLSGRGKQCWELLLPFPSVNSERNLSERVRRFSLETGYKIKFLLFHSLAD